MVMNFVHKLKTWPRMFHDVKSGEKTAEFRVDDRGFERGDLLILQEFEPDLKKDGSYGGEGRYTGREVEVKIIHILRGPNFGIPDGYVMMSTTRPKKRWWRWS